MMLGLLLIGCCYRPQRSWGKVIFSEAHVKNSVHGGACLAGGHAWQGDMHGRGHAWRVVCVAGGMCGGCIVGGMHGRGHAWQRGICVAGGCMAGGVHGRGHACHTHHPPHTMRYGRSMRGRYASYWNAFLLVNVSTTYKQRIKLYVIRLSMYKTDINANVAKFVCL